jgi:hypothetical protein
MHMWKGRNLTVKQAQLCTHGVHNNACLAAYTDAQAKLLLQRHFAEEPCHTSQ